MSGAFNEMIRVLADPNSIGENELVGFLAQDADTDVGLGGTFTGFVAHGLSTGGASSGSFTGFSVAPPASGFGGYTVVGYLYPDMAGTAFLGSVGFYQIGEGETNIFIGRTGFGNSPASSTTVRSSTPSGGTTGAWTNFQAYRNVNNTATGPGFDWYAYDAAIVQPNVAPPHFMNDVRFYNVTSPLSSQAVTIADAAGLYVEQLNGTANFTFTNNPFGIYQAGTTDYNAFLGKVFIGASAPLGFEDFRVNGDTYMDGQLGIHAAPFTTKIVNIKDDLSDTAGTYGIDVELDFGGGGTKTSWRGYSAFLNHSGVGLLNGTISFLSDPVASSTGTFGGHTGFRSQMDTGGSGTCVNYYGFRAASVIGTVTNAYGLYLDAQGGGTLSYGVYQAGASDDNYFAGQVGIGTAFPATSAALEINSTTGALLVPRMTTVQRGALTAVDGMIVYDTDVGAFYFREGGAWVTGSGLT
jgi:hypothetical protein